MKSRENQTLDSHKNKFMTNTKYTQGQRIYFEMGEKLPSGWGKVCGVVGPVIIIELEVPITGYNFTHSYILDAQVKPAPAEVVMES
jgi:hypothetical protein